MQCRCELCSAVVRNGDGVRVVGSGSGSSERQLEEVEQCCVLDAAVVVWWCGDAVLCGAAYCLCTFTHSTRRVSVLVFTADAHSHIISHHSLVRTFLQL